VGLARPLVAPALAAGPKTVAGRTTAPLDAGFCDVIAGMIGKENNSRKRD